MKDRIKIDGEWYIRENVATSEEQIDPTFFLGVSAGKFEFCVLLQENGSNEIWEDTQYVTIKGAEMIDSENFLRKFRDSEHDPSEMTEFSRTELNELRQLLIVATNKGWL